MVSRISSRSIRDLPAALLLKSDAKSSRAEDVALAFADAGKAARGQPAADERVPLARKAVCLRCRGIKPPTTPSSRRPKRTTPSPACSTSYLGRTVSLKTSRRVTPTPRFATKKRRNCKADAGMPRTRLGLRYHMRCLGRARRKQLRLLDKGFEADKFNIRVANMRKVSASTSKGYDTSIRSSILISARLLIRRTTTFWPISWPTI